MELRDLRARLEADGAGRGERGGASLDMGEAGVRAPLLWGKVAMHTLRSLLGATPLVLQLLPRFRLGAATWLLAPLVLYVVMEARRAISAFREIRRARRPRRRGAPSHPQHPDS